jgi:hypothetical protein
MDRKGLLIRARSERNGDTQAPGSLLLPRKSPAMRKILRRIRCPTGLSETLKTK